MYGLAIILSCTHGQRYKTAQSGFLLELVQMPVSIWPNT